MAFIGNGTLEQLLKASDIISDFNPKRIKNGAYEMSLGAQVFQTDSSPQSVKDLKTNEQIAINPGQFALLLTKEYVKIPNDKIAFISIKAGIKFQGLINVSGFHVDPGFEGHLLFSVFNAGPSKIILSNGTAYFPIWLADIDEPQDYTGSHDKQIRIPDEPVGALSQGELASPNVLSKKIDDNKAEIESRIVNLEKDNKANNYIAVTALGLIAAIIIKFVFDWNVLDKGFSKGIDIRSKEVAVDSIINLRLLEKKKLLKEIDSLKTVKKQIIQPQH